MDSKIEALARVKLFSSCTKQELKKVAALCTAVSLEEGRVLTKEGTPGHECFIISEGKATVTIRGQAVGVVGPGECVGEMALFDHGPRSATVTAQTPMTLFLMSASEFQDLLDVTPSISRRIASILAQRLRALETNQPH